MMLQRRQKEGFFRGCIVPILAFAGLLALCYAFCLVLYLLNTHAASSSGGFGLIPLG